MTWRKRTIMEMALEAEGMFSELPLMDAWVFGDESLEAFAKLVREDEREACAKVCEETDDGTPYNLAEDCAAAIRARGQA